MESGGAIMMKTHIAVLALALSLGACSLEPSRPAAMSVEDYIGKTYDAVDQILAQAERAHAERGQFNKFDPIIVATLVNIDELAESSRLGRSISEQVASRMTQRGYQVVELKLRGDLFVKRSEGELLLSREIKDISLRHKAQAVVVGTYAMAEKFVHVNLKVVTGDTHHALAAIDYGLPMDENTKTLISRGR